MSRRTCTFANNLCTVATAGDPRCAKSVNTQTSRETCVLSQWNISLLIVSYVQIILKTVYECSYSQQTDMERCAKKYHVAARCDKLPHGTRPDWCEDTSQRIHRKVRHYFGLVAYAISSIYRLISIFRTAAATTSSSAGETRPAAQITRRRQLELKEHCYRDVFRREFNIDFHQPKTDRCDTCKAYKPRVKVYPSASTSGVALTTLPHFRIVILCIWLMRWSARPFWAWFARSSGTCLVSTVSFFFKSSSQQRKLYMHVAKCCKSSTVHWSSVYT